MRTLTNRYEIAKVLNFGKYPVLSLDLATSKLKDYEGCYEGGKVRFKSKNEIWRGNIQYFYDSGLIISSDNAMLTASFGYKDIIEDLEIANAPLVEEQQDVVVIIHDSVKRIACVCITTITRVNVNCSTAIEFESGFKDIVKLVENTLGVAK